MDAGNTGDEHEQGSNLGRNFWCARHAVECDGTHHGKRRDGTDSVERKQVGNFSQQILNLLPKGKTIVLEGMRCVSRPMMNKLLGSNVDVGIIWIHISPEISFERNQAFGNKLTLEQAKRLDTTCRNFIRDYKGKVKIAAINTEKVKDFDQFSVNNLNEATSFEV